MGADIHTYLEVKVRGRWRLLRRWFPRQWSTGYQPYSDRNYYAFGLLAGVRGRAQPILPPRGWPEDASAPLRRMWRNICNEQGVSEHMSNKYGSPGEHSFSYYTARELTEFDWQAGWHTQGYTLVTHWRAHEQTQLQGYSMELGAVVYDDRPSDAELVLTHDEALAYTGGMYAPEGGLVYVRVEWHTSHLHLAGRFPGHMLGIFEEVMDEFGVGVDDVRLVFGFDS